MLTVQVTWPRQRSTLVPVTINGDLATSAGLITENASRASSSPAGTFVDPGTADTHLVTRSTSRCRRRHRAGGPGEPDGFTVNHVFGDDDPTATAADVMPVSVKVTDDDTGILTASIDADRPQRGADGRASASGRARSWRLADEA